MREIKFRAKRIDTREWVYGNLVIDDGQSFIINKVTEIDITNEADDETELITTEGYEVVPETVGQYTGLKDMKGIEIYEGDILLLTGHETVTYIRIIARSKRTNQLGWEDAGYCFCKYHCEEIFEIIGNIHDNPELLEADNV